ncbi:MAG: heavy-metal-associated domain-containing protein [Actinomycetota bacterium]|nr:heavy-metal-associated domain-containing protein [Actinomycetota bacterium]
MAELTEARLMTTGLHCRSCSMLVDMTVGDLDGVDSVSTDYVTGATDVMFDSDVVTTEDIVAAIRSAGYDVDDA